MIPFYHHSPDVPPAPFEGTIHYLEDGKESDIDAAGFFARTGSCYVRISFPSHSFAANKRLEGYIFASPIFSGASDTKLRLVRHSGPKAPAGFGVVADRAIYRGETICHYHGQYLASCELGSNYIVGSCDALQFRSLGAMVNHSFPNAELLKIPHGEIEEVAVVALEDIPKGEEVCINYDPTYPKICLGMSVELRYEAVERFINDPDMYQNKEKLFYLASNPAVLLQLYFLRDWSADQLKSFLEQVASYIEVPKYFYLVKNQLIASVGKLDSHLSQCRPDLYVKVKDYFLNAMQSISIIGAIYALKSFSEQLPRGALRDDDWEDTCPSLNLIIATGKQQLKAIQYWKGL